MKLAQPFYRLPLRFDAARLAEEVLQFTEAEWRPHPQGHAGNSALPFLSINGDPTNEGTDGPMRPTPHLARCPYLRQVMASFNTPIGRTRLMRIEGHGEATPHVDTNYYWSQRVRIHIPIITFPGVRFICGADEVQMGAGESWIFDTWRPHNVLNPDDRPRIHLVVDSVGSAPFWGLLAESGTDAFRTLPFTPGATPDLQTESRNFPVVMSPWEAQSLVTLAFDDLDDAGTNSGPAFHSFHVMMERFLEQWRAIWARFGDSRDGWPFYKAELDQLEQDLGPIKGQLVLPNGVEADTAMSQWLLRAALNPKLATPGATVSVTAPLAPPAAPILSGGGSPKPITPSVAAPTPAAPAVVRRNRFDRPVFIVASPRSGSSLLFETFAAAPGLVTLGGENHGVVEAIHALTPAAHGFSSNRLTEADATPAIIDQLQTSLLAKLKDRDGNAPANDAIVRMLEKTPKNALRIPFLAKTFPDARFIYLYRDPRENMASIIEAWASGRFVTYPGLPGWSGRPWSLLLIPGWQALVGKTPAEIAAAQWETANKVILDDLAQIPADHWCGITYSEFLANPLQEMKRLAEFSGLGWDKDLSGPLPNSMHTLTPPDPNKWRKHESVIEPLLAGLSATDQRARAASQSRGTTTMTEPAAPPPAPPSDPAAPASDPAAPASNPAAPTGGLPPQPGPSGPTGPESLRSVHTTSFPPLLKELGASLLVSTYQAGKLVVLRQDGDVLNTHFRNFPKPMGMALKGNRLALGTEIEVREFRNMSAVAKKLKPVGKHDTCFMPRSSHVTGDVQIHDLAFAGDELWFVNTSFSSLCTLDSEHSFIPRWRPKFVTALSPEDRCHLNGLAIVDKKPKYVTALGETDNERGWRERKRDGGILIDVTTNDIILRGLSMPHSPRWHQGKLWVLNSGFGGIGFVDFKTGKYEEVARVPGFTRGLDFLGRFAFIGLSQVRESAVFSGIAIADVPVSERSCGVWVVNIVTGKTVAFTKFEDAVQEIFAVQVAPGMRFPEILIDDKEMLSHSFVLPDAALAAVPEKLK